MTGFPQGITNVLATFKASTLIGKKGFRWRFEMITSARTIASSIAMSAL
jgi:hypothetical protein